MSETIQVASFYHGPPESGNGGYSCGLVAQLLEAETPQVTLRSPPPLDTPLSVSRDADVIHVLNGDTLVAEAQPSTLEVTANVPKAIEYGDAILASIDYAGFKQHPFPSCFVCGPQREPHEGLRLFAGRVRGRDAIAAGIVPEANISAEDGTVKREFVWAILDCPSGWAVTEFVPGREAVLGRLTASIVKPMRAGKRYSVMAWPIGSEGRKLHSGSAVFDYDGKLCAAARATWIILGS